ncbi:MAG TPA: hypothetical protein VE975_06705 [Actinomycetota bacterium]|nr:hypothetical protein [Actinomycetota bacterium]
MTAGSPLERNGAFHSQARTMTCIVCSSPSPTVVCDECATEDWRDPRRYRVALYRLVRLRVRRAL